MPSTDQHGFEDSQNVLTDNGDGDATDLKPHGQNIQLIKKSNGDLVNGTDRNNKHDVDIEYTESCSRNTAIHPPRSTFLSRIFPSGFKQENKKLIQLSWPIVVSMMLDQLHAPVCVAFIGHLGKIHLDAVSLANSLANVIGFTASAGLLGTCATFFSQSYGSANPTQVGVYLQTGLYIIGLSCLFFWTLTFNSNSILLLLGQNPVVAAFSEQYLIMYTPTFVFRNVNRVLQRYLNAQNIVYPSMIFTLNSNILHAILQYLFIYVFEFGVRGSAAAIDIAYFSVSCQHLVYIIVTKIYKKTWRGWSRESLLDWGVFMTMGSANILMVCLEWWTFEIGNLLMGILGTVELGAAGIMFSLWPMFGSLGTGQRDALAVRVGQHLGGKLPVSAMTVSRLGVMNGAVVGLVAAIALLALKDVLPRIFTSDPDVLDLATRQIPLLAIFALLVDMKWVCSGVIIGCGKQVIGGFVSFLSYFIVAMPVGIPLMFLTNQRSFGYWWGLNLGLLIGWVLLVLILNRTDWEKETEKAQLRAKIVKKKTKAISDEREGLLCNEQLSVASTLENMQQENVVLDDGACYTDTVSQGGHYGSLNKGGNIGQSMQSSVLSADLRVYDWNRIYIKRGLVLALLLSLFTFGLVCRFVIFIPDQVDFMSLYNTTAEENLSNSTTWTTQTYTINS